MLVSPSSLRLCSSRAQAQASLTAPPHPSGGASAAGVRLLCMLRRKPHHISAPATGVTRRARPQLVATAVSPSPDSPAAPLASPSPEVAALAGRTVIRVADGAEVDAASLVPPSGAQLLLFVTHTADFDSFEQATQLVDVLPDLAAAGVGVTAVCIGNRGAAQAFASFTRFPSDRLYSDASAACYAALGFAPGAGRPGGPAQWLAPASGMAKLMVMCAGIGSPGTLSEVFRGYLGDRSAPPVFGRPGSNVRSPLGEAFDTLGKGYQRPFELATLRGQNMVTVLQNWERLAPADDQLLVQRGGAMLMRDGKCVWRHNDAGILGYAPLAVVLDACGVAKAA
jgi:hypothetical protein